VPKLLVGPSSAAIRWSNRSVLLTFTKTPLKMAVEIKNLDGQVLDRKELVAGGSK